MLEPESSLAGASGAGQTELQLSSWSGLSIFSKLEDRDSRLAEALGVVGSSMVSSTAAAISTLRLAEVAGLNPSKESSNGVDDFPKEVWKSPKLSSSSPSSKFGWRVEIEPAESENGPQFRSSLVEHGSKSEVDAKMNWPTSSSSAPKMVEN